jgi:sirohydrochlorin ferrochelatase
MKRIIVQPHLLFRGFVLEEIRSAVSRRQTAMPGAEWIVSAHLGPEQEVVEAIRTRIEC